MARCKLKSCKRKVKCGEYGYYKGLKVCHKCRKEYRGLLGGLVGANK